MIYYELAYLSGIPQLAKYSEHTCFYPALILDLKKHNIRYTGQTTQRLEKRTSDHTYTQYEVLKAIWRF